MFFNVHCVSSQQIEMSISILNYTSHLRALSQAQAHANTSQTHRSHSTIIKFIQNLCDTHSMKFVQERISDASFSLKMNASNKKTVLNAGSDSV